MDDFSSVLVLADGDKCPCFQCFQIIDLLVFLQLLAVFMKLDTRSLLMNYIDLRRTNNVQLTFDALLVRIKVIFCTLINTAVKTTLVHYYQQKRRNQDQVKTLQNTFSMLIHGYVC